MQNKNVTFISDKVVVRTPIVIVMKSRGKYKILIRYFFLWQYKNISRSIYNDIIEIAITLKGII